MCCARNARADDVTNTEAECTATLSQFKGCKGVGSLSRLREGNKYISLIYNGVAVTELRCVLYNNWDSAVLLNKVLTDKCCVPRGAASDNDYSLRLEPLLTVVCNTWKGYCLAVGRDTTTDTVGQGLRLLKNLLEHKVWVATLLKLLYRHLQLGNLNFALGVVRAVVNLKLCSAINYGNIAIVKVDNLVCVLNNRSCV